MPSHPNDCRNEYLTSPRQSTRLEREERLIKRRLTFNTGNSRCEQCSNCEPLDARLRYLLLFYVSSISCSEDPSVLAVPLDELPQLAWDFLTVDVACQVDPLDLVKLKKPTITEVLKYNNCLRWCIFYVTV